MFTRDSVVWWIGMIGAVIVGLATVGDADLVTRFGIPEPWLPYLRLAALIVGVVSGWMKTSPMPHSEEGARKITPSGR